MKHYKDWKVVMWSVDGERLVNGGFDAVRGLAWFRWLHAWWSSQELHGEQVKIELWRGKHQVISLVIRLVGLLTCQEAVYLVWLRHWRV
jgi:hypothetical protein